MPDFRLKLRKIRDHFIIFRLSALFPGYPSCALALIKPQEEPVVKNRISFKTWGEIV
ncbi:hypothetical protein VUJ46_05410 [Chryseobacterium sp. MYb264]|uniref:hypothetical protein n=1 Tax=Chryseobacterium sp. MYb264 TaxID=2745153 RepID=UPI002E0E1F71|nr:hypothetical protein VUJ46_05410 [Chryseobacterium sp. MYb264]